jgi:hypothetical protein
VKDGGYLRLYRRALRDVEHGGDPLWNEPRVWSRAEAWTHLMTMAAHTAHYKTLPGGRVLHLERGEFVASLRFLGRRWGWNKDKVARFLATLVSSLGRLVRTNRDTDGDTYLVVNFDYYNSGRDSKRDDGETPARQSRDKVEEGKKKVEEGNLKTSAPRLADESATPQPVLIFPCQGAPREWTLTPSYLAELVDAYPGLDVLYEVKRALAWVRSNRPKTARGMKRFLNSWLDTEANGRRRGPMLPFGGQQQRTTARTSDEDREKRAKRIQVHG